MTAPHGACCGPIGATNVHRDCPRTWDDGGRVRVCGCSEPTCPCGQANAQNAHEIRGNGVATWENVASPQGALTPAGSDHRSILETNGG